jgi:dihydroorotate dehydrogenase
VSSADDVMAMLRAGATCVDLYSAFVYAGWSVARDIKRELGPYLGRLSARGRTISDAKPQRIEA